MIGQLADGIAFLERFARLLNVDVDVPDGADDTGGLMHEPAGVGIGHEDVTALQLGRDGADALDVCLRIAADLELKFPISLRPVAGDLAGHGFGGFLRDGAVEQELFAVAAAEQVADRLAGCLAKNIPAGHIESGFNVRMPFERGVHVAVELRQLRGILADQRRGKHLDTGTRALGVGRQVDRAKRADFAVAGDALVGLDPYDGAVKHLHGFAAGPIVGALV